MKKFLRLLSLALALCLALPAVSALAGKEESDAEAFARYARVLRDKKVTFRKTYPSAFKGKVVIGVYYDPSFDPLEISTEEIAREGGYRDIPDGVLAGSFADADWALLVYGVASVGEDDRPVIAHVFPINLKYGTYYRPYDIRDRGTRVQNGKTTADLDDLLQELEDTVLLEAWESWAEKYDESYRLALNYLEEDKFYKAYEAFLDSSSEGAWERAQECIQPWPRDGVVWRNSSAMGSGVDLTFKVNQDREQAMVIRILKNDRLVCVLFVGGPGQVTVSLSPGTYTIRDGTGEDWFGVDDAFGRKGSYETMTFNGGMEAVTLQNNYSYTITVNVQNADPDADGVGSHYEDYDSFFD